LVEQEEISGGCRLRFCRRRRGAKEKMGSKIAKKGGLREYVVGID